MMRKTATFFSWMALTAMIAFAPHVWAQSNAPLDITADNALEWQRGENRYVARGNAVASQGNQTLKGQTLTAYYDPTDGGATDLTRILADGNVTLIRADTTITGSAAEYDLRTEKARVTGSNLKMSAPGMQVVANEYFEYDSPRNRITAKGDAVATEGETRLETETIVAHLSTNENGKRVVKSYEAPVRVKIITPTETAEGDRGTYNPATEMAILTGNVVINQGQNVLKGEKAEVNMQTGVSRMFAAPDAGASPAGRVTGRFYPKGSQPNE